MDFYVDSAIFSGFVMNFIIFKLSGEILKIKRIPKFALSAAMLSCAAVVQIFFPIIKIFYIPICTVAVIIAFGKCSAAELIRRFFICTGISVLLGGLYLCASPPNKLGIIYIGGKSFYVASDLFFYSSLLVIYFSAKIIIFFLTARKKRYRIKIKIGGKVSDVYAFTDTGNSLRTPNGEPIILAEKSLFGEFSGAVTVQCRSAASDSEQLSVYPVEYLFFSDSKKYYCGSIYAAASNAPFSGGCSVLLNSCIKDT